MNPPIVEGQEVMVGDRWELRSGAFATVSEIRLNDHPCQTIQLTGQDGGTFALFPNGKFQEGSVFPVDMLRLVSRLTKDAEPELPEDIADQFEVTPDEGTERQILHAHRDDGRIYFYYRWRNTKNSKWMHTEGIDKTCTFFRRKERWETGAFVSEETLATSSIDHTAITHERNTATGEIREVGSE